MNLFDLHGRTALVTGAANGIGRAAARALARFGADVLLVDVREEPLRATCSELSSAGARAVALVGDVRRDEDVERIAAQAIDRAVDVVVNNAGIMLRQAVAETTVEDLDRLWQVNVRGLFAVTQALLPHLVANGTGKIINIGSLGSVLGLERRTAYALTKGAVRQYTQSLAAELAADGICVNAIAPGYIETDMSAAWLADDARRQQLLDRIPQRRFGRPSDLEGTFVFLASRASDYMTGQILVVDGGWTAW